MYGGPKYFLGWVVWKQQWPKWNSKRNLALYKGINELCEFFSISLAFNDKMSEKTFTDGVGGSLGGR